nr:MAG TPA: hypothetical protein [Bacteriophage sp.]
MKHHSNENRFFPPFFYSNHPPITRRSDFRIGVNFNSISSPSSFFVGTW